MELNHVLKMFGLVTWTDHEQLKKEYTKQLSNLKDDLRNERRMKRQLQREIGNFLLELSRITKNEQYDSLGRKLRTQDSLSPDEISEGVKLFYYQP